MQTTENSEQDHLQCMEVRGGHGQSANFFQRPGLDVWIWSQTQREAESEGGDMHYISSCASGRITRMLLADVGGTENLFTDVADNMRDLMKKNINVIAQTSAVRQMSSNLDNASEKGGFASTLLSTYFAPLRSFAICNAGHPPPMLYRAATGEWHLLKSSSLKDSDDLPPSGNVSPNEFQSLKLSLEVGDMVLSYSNALTECRGRDGKTLGLMGLRSIVRQLNHANLDENALDGLIERIRGEHPDNLQEDDITVMLSKVTGARVRMRDNFLAPFRLARRTILDRTSL